MADLDFSVNADTTQAVRSLKTLENAIGTVTGAFGAIAAGLSLSSLAQFSDSITSIRNRLIQLTDSQEQAAAQLNGLAAIAIRSRTSLEGVSDLYYRIARSSKDLGVSQAEAAQITETVAKALSMSGVSAGEARGPLLQLGQALQSGRLQGDELRSVMEGLGPVAKILADSLGVPVGQLKNLGAAGQISAEQVVQALLKAKDAVDQGFAKTIPTISSAFQELKTIASIAFNNFEQNTRTAESLAEAIRGLGYALYSITQNIDDFIDRWGNTIAVIGKVVLAFAAFSIVGRIAQGIVAAFGLVIGTLGRAFSVIKNAGEAISEVAAVAGVAGKGFSGWAQAIGYVFQSLSGVAKVIGGLIGATLTLMGLGEVTDWFKQLGDSNSSARKEIEKNRQEYDKFLESFDKTKGKAAGGFVDPKYLQQLDQQVLNYKRGNAELERRLNFEQALIGVNDQQKTIRQSLFDLETTYVQEINRLLDEYRVKSQSKNKDDLAALPEIQKRIQDISKNYEQQIGVVQNLTRANYDLKAAEQLRLNLQDFSAKTIFDSEKKLRDLRDDMAKMTMTELEKKIYDVSRASEELARSEIERENSSRRRLGLQALSAEEEAKFYSAASARNKDLIAQTTASYEASRTWSNGWTQAFNSYVESATNAAEQAKSVFEKATRGMEDMFVNFAKTGKFEFKNFIASIAEELLRSNIRRLIAQSFGGGGGGGGILSNLFAGFFATGGSIPAGRFGVVGERGPELVSGPATVNPLTGGQTVVYNINAVDALSFKQMVARDPGFIHAVALQGARTVPGVR
jgi:lambda family phage tail tape measure protein